VAAGARPCHTRSLQRLILLPIKRSRTLVNGGVAIVISVRLIIIVWLRCLWLCVPCRKIPVPRHPLIRAKSGPLAQPECFLLRRTSDFLLLAFTSDFTFLPNCFTATCRIGSAYSCLKR